MVELKNVGVSLAAVNARVALQVLVDEDDVTGAAFSAPEISVRQK